MSALLWGHAALSSLTLVGRFLPPSLRDRFIRLLCLVGAGLGVALLLERRSGDAWRTTVIEPVPAVLAGLATAAAWVICAVLVDEDDRWRAASIVGVGASALVLFAATQWAVPALLFWMITSIAAVALSFRLPRRGEVWLAIVISDLCFAAGMISHILDADSWRLPLPATDRAFWFLLAAVLIRAGTLPRFGSWRALGTPAAPALPLLVGGALVLVTGPVARSEPWVAVALLVVALAQAVWGAARRSLATVDLAGWPTAVGLGLIFVAPDVTALAGSAALLAVGALAVWPIASGRAQPERGLLLALVPLTAAFGAVVFAAKRAFEVSTTLDASLESAPWIAVTALIPLVMAAGAVLGARVGRETSSAEPLSWPVFATWVFVAGSVGLGLVPGALELPDDVVGPQSSFLTLLAVAIVAGALAGWLWNLRHPDHRRTPAPEPRAIPAGPRSGNEALALRRPSGLVDKMLDLVAVVLALATLGAVGWVTFEGLSQGFL